VAGRPGASITRLIAGIVLGAALAALGALLLGEYPFTGVMPYISGVLFALVVAEVIVSVSYRSDRATAVAAAICTAGGLAWGVWISVGEGKAPIPIGGWVAVIIGAVVALVRGGIRAGGRSGPSSQPAS
jgi:ABC-type Mn2+/Zn2+ transport system permease subunit